MKLKRPLACLIAFVLMFLFAVGCQPQATTEQSETQASVTSSESTSTTEPIKNINRFGWAVPEKTIEINCYNGEGYYAPTEEQKQGRANMEKYLLEEFNVKINMMTTDGDGTEYLNLMLSTGEYPEVIYNISYENVLRLKDLEKAQDLTNYVEMYGQDIIKDIGDLYPLFLDSENKLWYIPIGVGALMELPDYSAHVRWDEYTAIGKPKIETPDDYYNVINQILEEFPTTPAGESRYTLSLYDQGDPAGSFGGYWGLKRGWKESSDHSLTYWAFTDEGKAMTKWFNRWWTDGKMDPDAFANNFDEWKAKFSNERIVGAIGGWWIAYNAGHEIWMLTDPNWTEDKRFVQVGFKAPEAEAATVTGKNKYGWANTVITDKADNIEEIMKFINFQATEPLGLALFGWGIPNGVPSYKDPNKLIKLWNIDENGNWSFDPEAKQQFITETWDYPAEGVVNPGVFVFFTHCNRWADGVHCIWGNQMWYEENKWKSMMIENMKGTIYDFTPMALRDKDQNVVLTEQAIKDTWKQHWPLVVQSANDAEFDQRWTEFQEALRSVGIEEYTKITENNYKNNLAKLGQK
ncbi:MAG: sugar ABC transporter substrate-binding protein [Clostridia bacterium]|nr:sugar ABC transporter substrate-binding protein [Clostridia bacterium]